ncbi:MAG: squalene synthase HpnC [Phycisphaerales bacterium]|nr:MAG: squalene synthase HpnC [Phycisphaerales bacterium]
MPNAFPTPMLTLDPTRPIVEQLSAVGPPGSRASGGDVDSAIAYCRGLARAHEENFPVLTALVPRGWRDDFAAVYAFCRWADDLADETGHGPRAREHSMELLAWWREELEACYAGEPRHPVFVALRPSVERRELPKQAFLDLIDAFEQDQRVTRYASWADVLGYCTRSADPVGRLVLSIGIPPSRRTPGHGWDEIVRTSDAVCSALQLTNFWQDARRDLVERDRVYLPSEITGLDDATLRAWLDRGDDAGVRARYGEAIGPLLARTRAMFEEGRSILSLLRAHGHGALVPIVRLFIEGGERTLALVEREPGTLWARPKLGKGARGAMVARAWAGARIGALGAGRRGGAS